MAEQILSTQMGSAAPSGLFLAAPRRTGKSTFLRSLSQALAELSNAIQRPIVLIIDEAQHAITSDRGYDAMAALKAARDELNSSRHHGLRVVATGSNRDKLAMLRNSRDQAFYGAPLVKFPPLGRDFIQWFCEGVGLAVPLNPERVWRLFEKSGFRPEKSCVSCIRSRPCSPPCCA